MKVVLVGATGFVGRHLLAALHAAGHQLIATSRRPQPQGLPGVEWCQLDLDCLGREPQLCPACQHRPADQRRGAVEH